ncbi:hypothetical protein FJY93_03740 [Candidatus Kaiserbacteria bacterium]|nr:hypothetical protein [Candidatus Kaiserbacteria bacterium]
MAFIKSVFNFLRLIITMAAVLIGVACLALAYFYYSTPSDLLPPILTGHIPDSGETYYRHAFASLGIGIALLIFTWMLNSIGRKKPMQAPDNLTASETLKL